MRLIAPADLGSPSFRNRWRRGALAQRFFRLPTDATDHSPALNGQAFADFFRPARQVFIFVRLQEFTWVVVGSAKRAPLRGGQRDLAEISQASLPIIKRLERTWAIGRPRLD